MKSNYLLLIANTALILAGCGGGGDGGDEPVVKSNATELSGAVIDGYIKGATVCLDLNNNFACDATEPSAESGEKGAYSFEYSGEIPPGTQILADVPITAEDEQLGPIDKPYNMLAPFEQPEVVTPLTTLVSQEILSSGKALSPEEAEVSVKLALGIDANTKLLANDFIGGEDQDLQNTAEVLAEALASAKKVLEDDPGASTLTAAEITKAAIRTVKDVIAFDLIVGGKATKTVAEVAASVTTTVQGEIQNIVAATKSGDGEVVSLLKVIQEGKLITVSDGEQYNTAGNNEWVEGLTMEFIYVPEAEEGKIIDFSSTFDKIAFLSLESEDSDWIPIAAEEDYIIGAGGTWSLPSENEGSGIMIKENCATFYDDGENASRQYCFVRKDLSGKRIGDIFVDLCTDGGVAVPGCNAEMAAPEGSYVYDFTVTVPNNQYGGEYQTWFNADWSGYVGAGSGFDQTIEGFIELHQDDGKYGSRGDDCNSVFRVKSYDASAKTGIFEWVSNTTSGCDWGAEDAVIEETTVEETTFEVVQAGLNTIIKTPSPQLYRANNPGELHPFLTFAKVPNGQGSIGIYGGTFAPSGTRLSLPFNGNIDYGIFASRVLVDFVLDQTGEPAFPYATFLSED